MSKIVQVIEWHHLNETGRTVLDDRGRIWRREWQRIGNRAGHVWQEIALPPLPEDETDAKARGETP